MCVGVVVVQVADLKLKSPSFTTLSCLAEAVGPQFIMAQLHKKAAAHKNPKVRVHGRLKQLASIVAFLPRRAG